MMKDIRFGGLLPWPRAMSHEPGRRSWASPSDVDPGSGTAEQIALMRSLIAGAITAPDFARSWLAARRRALLDGERLRENFDQALNEIFYALEEYAIDPDLRDADDLSDEELIAIVRDTLSGLG